MALNPSAEGKRDPECTEAGDPHPRPDSSSSATSAAAANQNGDQAGCEDSVMPEQEASERRKSGQAAGDAARSTSGSSPLPAGHGRPPAADDPLLPRRSSFQIPRKKNAGGKGTGMYDFLPPESRGFDDLKKLLASFYLDQSSRGSFTYCKARLIHNELLEKEFIEKRRAMKQEGRTEAELAESYCFLFPDKARLPWICEKGLSVGHSRNSMLGNPASGVYLSKFSDLLQINPFEAGVFGDMIVFKVMRGRIKHIYDSMPKNAVEPNQKFDCHISKSANRVSSLLSYRAFELTQQYFFEFAFEEIKARPRHVCPYAVVTFTYKGKDAVSAPLTSTHRFNIVPQAHRGKSCYTVWSGPLMNKGQEMFQVCVRSSTRPYLPFKLPERLDLSRGMQLDQAKRKIPAVLFSWDTYTITREVYKCGMFCSLFEVVDGKGKPANGSLAGLVHKLERDRMVLVQPLFDKGFLFLLTSTQMVNPDERWGRVEKSLHALFIFQESRAVAKYPPPVPREVDPLSVDHPPAVPPPVEPFLPALHYALYKLRPNPGKDLSAGVEHRANEYLSRLEVAGVRPFIVPDYKQNLDERGNNYPAPRAKHNIEGQLRTYVHNPGNYTFALAKARDMIDKIRNPAPQVVHVLPTAHIVPTHVVPTHIGPTHVVVPASAAPPLPPVEYSPVSDWGGSDMGSTPAERLQIPPERSSAERLEGGGSSNRRSSRSGHPSHSNGSQAEPKSSRPSSSHGGEYGPTAADKDKYDKDKMKELLKLIHQHKKNLGGEPGPGERRPEDGPDAAWDPHSLKRKMEADDWGRASKHPRCDPMSNGEPSRDDAGLEDGGQNFNLMSVMESMGIYDTDLRARGAAANSAQSSSVNETQRLLKILLATLNKAMTHGALGGVGGVEPGFGEQPSSAAGPPVAAPTNYVAEDMDCSPASPPSPPSPVSPGSPLERPHTSDNPAWAVPTHQEPVQTVPEPVANVDAHAEPKPAPATEVKKAPAVTEVKKVAAVAEVKMVAPVTEVKKVAPVAELKMAPPEALAAEVKKGAPEAEVKKAAPVASVAEVKKPASPPPPPRIVNIVEEPPQRPSISLDTILNQEVYHLTSDIRSLMQNQHIYYSSQLPQRLPPQPRSWLPNRAFSGFVVPYVTPVPVHGHVNALCERMGRLLPTPSIPPTPPPLLASPKVTAPSSHAPGSDLTAPNPSVGGAAAAAKTKAEPSHSKSDRKLGTVRGSSSAKAKAEASSAAPEIYSPSRVTPDSPEQSPATPAPGSTLLANSLIGQLKPEVFTSLVEIFKDVTKNTVKFYIHSEGEGNGSSTICKEIQEYLQSLGNRECNPQAFLENSGSLDKLLIIIQNEDIAAHVHKIPALVSLKKLSSVSFAGVDSLDDVKNHTYNELFVSGGFIVSDEFFLNPELISQEQLQGLLGFLEEQCTPEHPWQWKVHCKSQKKLKELGRVNSNAMGLLNLLTVYQKKHLVEFLPYHECDTQSRQAPDLDCLIKLQAQHTQQRHLIFLTERPFEMFLQYSRNGIVIASIDDIMTSFHSLIGSIDQNELPTPPSTVNEECAEAEDMSLDSDDGGEPSAIAEPSSSQQNQGPPVPPAPQGPPAPPAPVPAAAAAEKPPQPPPPETEEFRPPLPDQQQTTPGSTPKLSTALSTALSQFKATNPMASAGGVDVGSMSPGGFAVNPHQSFLCPTASWAPYTAATAFTASPAYPASPCSVTQEQEYRPPAPASVTTIAPTAPTLPTPAPGAPPLLPSVPPLPPHLTPAPVPNLLKTTPAPSLLTSAPSLLTTVSPLANMASLPMEVKPPPPPHLMMLGHMYGSDPTGAYTSTNSAGGTPTRPGDRTHGAPGEAAAWGAAAAGKGACDTSTMQGVALPGAVAHSGLVQAGEWSEAVGGNTPGSQGGRTPVDCSDSLGAAVGTPTAGGSAVRPKLPTHALHGGPYGCIGAIPGQMDQGALRGPMGPGSLGGYRGRGVPPGAQWPRPGLGEGPGGGPCSWGYPMGRGRGQDYYTYSHSYSP